MSLQLIQQYHTKVERLIQYGGSRNEASIRSAFQNLLEQYCAGKGLELIAELDYRTLAGKMVRPDGTVKDALRQSWGYWESKDQFDTLEEEIAKKIGQGYPTTNILFEDSQVAVLIQNGQEAGRTVLANASALDSLLKRFVGYEPPEVQNFRLAIERFKADLPDLLATLRPLIEQQAEINTNFAAKRAEFLELCQQVINPEVTLADVREMLIQHILTEDIFTSVFNESQFHRENNVARELQAVTSTFFTGVVRRNILDRIALYVNIIRAAASNIVDHHEKQRFLKVVYENFYKAYNPAGADKLGIVYTPNEIVRFVIEGTEWLTDKHWGRLLSDHNVEILDPATGTGTFITELIDYLPPATLPYKYANEIHCNEVAILPYYIANLNIEYTYKQKMGVYGEFKNICFVDTLDNLGFEFAGKQGTLFGLAAENVERIKRQNERTISVIIGNPPYRANQENENDNNKNREYKGVDKRIRETYIKHSKAQKTKQYDMFTRFLRWSSDRLDKNGIIAFVTNRAFIDAKQADGFRKVVTDEFNEIYIVDLKGDAHTSGERRRREGGNVFNNQIRVGVAVYFLVRREGATGCHIYYNAVADYVTAEAKKAYLRDNKLMTLPFTHIIPDRRHNWIDQDETSWDELLPVATKETKLAKRRSEERAIFKLFSPGVSTNRDEWIVDFSPENIEHKMAFLVNFYNQYRHVEGNYDTTIKWSRNLKQRYEKGLREPFERQRIQRFGYRPFCLYYFYNSGLFVDEQGLSEDVFAHENVIICMNTSDSPFGLLASSTPVDLHFIGDTQFFPMYRNDNFGNRRDNITEWAVQQFHTHYQDTSITRLDIFHYVYAALHNPVYRTKYEINLTREFPRIPFYENFHQWAGWGKQLMDLHINYETVDPYPLERIDDSANLSQGVTRPRLKADKTKNQIELDKVTTLRGVPPLAWTYKLGNRSALEWVLERYQEKKPRDPTIADQFNTYRFADYKEQVIDLLGRVCTVSVATMEIVAQMISE